MPPRIPQPEDFTALRPAINVALTYPEVPETTTAILLLFHGLGDSETPFTTFATSVALPGVLGISVRGVSPLPPALLGLSDDELASPSRHFHWGDDLTIDSATGGLDPDPGFTKAKELVFDKLIKETLVDKCGWDFTDILLFGYGQGGSLALGLASKIRADEVVVDVTDGAPSEATLKFKGVVSVGGPLPASLTVTNGRGDKARTPVLICYGRSSELVDAEAVTAMKKEFADTREAKWQRRGDDMPGSRDEMLPIMQFFAERLQSEQ